ncbi:lipase 3 [Anabrus simplex]|uniref:lipase 3 n=1 Tax=Anabrus simplex TaxID=316456 RepID=UPI0035A2D77C
MTSIAITSLLIGGLAATIVHTTEEEFFLETPDLVRRHGYPSETHNVTTEDGYILTVHRIPYAMNSTHGASRPAVVLMHGFLGSSTDWLILGRHNGYGYVLANSGYDVWLPNGRGNVYSREHVSLSTNETAFWNFSWHENGIYDLPAVIDYILTHNGQSKLFYVGYSMGATMFYVMASEKPEYNEKIRAMISLAPVAYMNHVRSPALQLLARTTSYLTLGLQLLGLNEIPLIPNSIRAVSVMLCKDKELEVRCTALLGSLIDASYLNKDVERLYKELHNPVPIYKIPLKNFKHTDFMWGSTAKKMAFQKSIEFMKSF